MKVRSSILRCASFALLLIFSQKVGVGLFLHSLIHDQSSPAQYSTQGKDKTQEISFACNCIDDFLVPFDEPEAVVIPQALISFSAPVYFFQENIPFYPSIFSSLRGPPMSVSVS